MLLAVREQPSFPRVRRSIGHGWGTAAGGLLVGASIDPGTDERQAAARGLRYVWVTAEHSGEVLERITERIEAGRLRVTVQRTYPLAEAAEAHRAIEEKRTTGKIVLVP